MTKEELKTAALRAWPSATVTVQSDSVDFIHDVFPEATAKDVNDGVYHTIQDELKKVGLTLFGPSCDHDSVSGEVRELEGMDAPAEVLAENFVTVFASGQGLFSLHLGRERVIEGIKPRDVQRESQRVQAQVATLIRKARGEPT